MDLEAALAEWNPWWQTGRVPEVLAGRRRRLLGQLGSDLDAPEALVLAGIRRSGKTTLLYQLVQLLLQRGGDPRRVLYVNLEDMALDGVGLEDIAAAHRRVHATDEPRYLLVDEVQTREGWERWVRGVVDRRRDRVAVTGSTSALLGGEYASLLTGRHLTTRVRPLDFAEYLAFHDRQVPPQPAPQEARDAMVHALDGYLARGGFPEPNRRSDEEARRLLQHYFRDMLQRDLVEGRGLDPVRLRRLAVYLAQTPSRIHTKRSLQHATGLARDTLRDYLDALEDAFLLVRLPRFTWSPKPEARDQAPFKAYLADTGLARAVAPPGGQDRGRLAEALVANALDAADARPGYWTDGRGRHEVDFVVPRDEGRVDAYQVTYGPDVPEREAAALVALRDSLPRGRVGSLTVLTRTREDMDDGVSFIPLWRWLLDPLAP